MAHFWRQNTAEISALSPKCSDVPKSDSPDGDFYINHWNNSSILNGPIGSYQVDINVSKGDGGMVVYLVDSLISIPGSGAGFGAAVVGGLVMGLPHLTLSGEVFGAREADHELGHSFGNIHSEELPDYQAGQPANLMDASATGPPIERHIETLVQICGL